MNFSKTYTIESQRYPGAVITLKRIGPQKRAEIELAVSLARSRQRELAEQQNALRPELDKVLAMCEVGEDGKIKEASIPPQGIELGLKLQAIRIENAALLRSRIEPAYVRAAVKSITEITYEGQPATAELLCEYGPEDLFDEVAKKISEEVRLSAEVAENLESPSTSAAAVDGQTTNTTATPASSDQDSRLNATA